jgi:hypothetical protein
MVLTDLVDTAPTKTGSWPSPGWRRAKAIAEPAEVSILPQF